MAGILSGFEKGGLLMVGYMMIHGFMYLMLTMFGTIQTKAWLPKYPLPFNSRQLEEAGEITINPEFGYEFSHTLEERVLVN